MRRIVLFLLVLPLVIALSTSAAWAGATGIYYAIDDSTNSLYTIDPNTFALNLIGALGVAGDFGDLAYNPNSGIAYWAAGRGNDSLYTINLNTGAATLVGSHGIDDLFALAYDTVTNTLYGDSTNGNFYSINPNTGASTFIGSNGIYPGGLTFNPDTGQLVLAMAGGNGSFYSIDPNTGMATLLGSPGFLNDNGVTWDPVKGKYIVVDWSGNLYEVDPNNWTYTVASGLNGDSWDGIIDVGGGGNNTVPEPGSLALLGTGFVMLAGKFRRKK
jgi:hypothetical protein